MRAWLLNDFSGLGALQLAEIPTPAPGHGEVLLKVHFAALNPADRYLAEKLYPLKPPLPHVLGRDGLGTVVQCGPGVVGIKPGDRRMILRGDAGGTRPGTFAEYVVVPADDLACPPEGWTSEQAAGAVLVYLTAYQALTFWGTLPEESVVLVTGASGGVGIASVQLALAMGQRVISLSRSPEKRQALLKMGCLLALDPADPGWRTHVKTRARLRVNLAIDNIGGTLLPEVIDTLAENGCVSLVGRLAGPVPNFNTATLFFRRLRMGGIALGANTRAESFQAWDHVLSLLRKAAFKPVVDSVFPFGDLHAAFEHLARGPMGKVLLAVSTPGL